MAVTGFSLPPTPPLTFSAVFSLLLSSIQPSFPPVASSRWAVSLCSPPLLSAVSGDPFSAGLSLSTCPCCVVWPLRGWFFSTASLLSACLTHRSPISDTSDSAPSHQAHANIQSRSPAQDLQTQALHLPSGLKPAQLLLCLSMPMRPPALGQS